IGLTRSAASKYAANDIRFNAIAPALVETPMSERAQESPGILEYTRRRQPLDGGRIGQARDVDGAVVYFLSDQSAFVTGQVVSIDGGWEVSDGQ
ncbi:MAG: SDR family oxidoreductase, partial [Planctomycetota bacterium]|nr:SDR family oxidoreductase [Planctomycetota bacterium]